MAASLTNFPTKKEGMSDMVLILAMPAAVNKGVEGSGISV